MSDNFKTKIRSCHCRWPDCERMRKDLLNSSGSSHVWAGKIVRFQFPIRDPALMSVNKLASYKSLCLHILSNENINKVPASIYLYPHHFPEALLQWHRSQVTNQPFRKPLTIIEAKTIDDLDNGSQSLYDKSNTVAYYCKKGTGVYKKLSPMKLKEYQFKKEYIQSPLTLQHEVQSYIATCRATDMIEPTSINITDKTRNNVIKTQTCMNVNLNETDNDNQILLPIKLATVFSSPMKDKMTMGSR